jgi:hypothetical protein
METICPYCGSTMKTGSAEIHGTVMGFLLMGASYENLYFKPDGEKEIKILDSRSSTSASWCENCEVLFLNNGNIAFEDIENESDFSQITRENIFGLLGLFASNEQQAEYLKNYPDLNLADEMFIQWNDCYKPELDDFSSSFNEMELSLLSKFDAEIKRINSRLKSMLQNNNLPYSIDWRNINQLASEILRSVI